ncbi:hypothetical protein Y1Q_0011632 [Alligator mississippiensis]|uniref:Uncharacterized protein n=1 Tax=Alligator mississippiensis TaxID=8496 RepID=A0A151M0I7_ALLMI|nr:hypothetical protein Y1Q_0011632 [Alligator mississippiensis]
MSDPKLSTCRYLAVKSIQKLQGKQKVGSIPSCKGSCLGLLEVGRRGHHMHMCTQKCSQAARRTAPCR